MRQIIYLILFLFNTVIIAQEEHIYPIDFRDSLWQQDLMSQNLHAFDPMNHHSDQPHSNRQLTFRNDATELLDSVYSYVFDPINDEWILFNRRLNEYNEEGQLISTLSQIWYNTLQVWKNDSKYLSSYDQEGRLHEYLTQQFDQAENEFVNDSLEITMYNQEGKVSKLSMFKWNKNNQEWKPTSDFQYTYDEVGNQITQIYRNARSTGELENSTKIEYIWEGKRLLESFTYRWNFLDEWINRFHSQYIYIENLITEISQQVWDSGSQQWRLQSRQSYTYNDDGLETLWLYQNWSAWISDWTNNRRTLQAYSGDDLVLQTYEGWNDHSMSWEGERQFKYTHFENGEIESLIQQRPIPTDYDSVGDVRYLATYDEVDSLSELIYQNWNIDSEVWENVYKWVMTYNQHGNIIYEGIFDWDFLENQWVAFNEEFWIYESDTLLIVYTDFQNRITYQHDSINQLIVETHDHLFLDSMIWVNDDRILYSYDSYKQLVELKYQNWENEWINRRRHLYTYNQQGLVTESIFQLYGQEWTNHSRTLNEYNEADQVVISISQFWYDQWQNGGKLVYTYHPNSEIKLITDMSWSTIENDWVNRVQTLNSYDQEDRLVKSEMYDWDEASASWVIRYEDSWGYDANGNLIEDLRISHIGSYGSGVMYLYDDESKILEQADVTWDTYTQTWIKTDLVTYSYDNNGNAIELIHFIWYSEQALWQPLQRAELAYDTSEYPVSILWQVVDEESGAWHSSYLLTLQYNENGQTLEEAYYDMEPSEFTWSNRFRYDYFRSEHITGITELPSQQLDCHYPNPFSANGNTIVCEPVEGIGRYQLDLLDLTGRKIHSEIILPGDPVTLDRTFPQGSYILLIRDKGSILHRNKLMIFD